MKYEPRVYVLVCGDREYEDDYIISIFMYGMRSYHGLNMHLFHGGARGADSLAAKAANDTNGWIEHAFPIPQDDWDKYGKGAGHVRNKRMLDAMMKEKRDEDITFAIAFKDELYPGLAKGGTEDMIKQCQGAGLVVYHVAMY